MVAVFQIRAGPVMQKDEGMYSGGQKWKGRHLTRQEVEKRLTAFGLHLTEKCLDNILYSTLIPFS